MQIQCERLVHRVLKLGVDAVFEFLIFRVSVQLRDQRPALLFEFDRWSFPAVVRKRHRLLVRNVLQAANRIELRHLPNQAIQREIRLGKADYLRIRRALVLHEIQRLLHPLCNSTRLGTGVRLLSWSC